MVQNDPKGDSLSDPCATSVKKPNSKVDTSLALSIASWLRKHGKVVHPPLSKSSRQQLKECFELMDADGSGAIDVDELYAAFKLLGLNMKRSEVVGLLEEVDKDCSGEVDYTEFLQIMTNTLGRNSGNDAESNANSLQMDSSVSFSLMATAYRRKRLMEGLISRDKGVQEQIHKMEEELNAAKLPGSLKTVVSGSSRFPVEANTTANHWEMNDEEFASSLIPRRIKDQNPAGVHQLQGREEQQQSSLETVNGSVDKAVKANRAAKWRQGLPCLTSVRQEDRLKRHIPVPKNEKELFQMCSKFLVSAKNTGHTRKAMKLTKKHIRDEVVLLPPLHKTIADPYREDSLFHLRSKHNFWENISSCCAKEDCEKDDREKHDLARYPIHHDIQQNGLRRKTLLFTSTLFSSI